MIKKIALFLFILGLLCPVTQTQAADAEKSFTVTQSTAFSYAISSYINDPHWSDKRGDWWKTATPTDIENLIKEGANVNAKYDFGSTPLQMALRNKNFAVAETLIKHGADINARPFDLPLWSQVSFSDNQTIHFLIDHGMKLDDPSFIRNALKHGDDSVLEKLSARGVNASNSAMSGIILTHLIKKGDVASIEQMLADGADANANILNAPVSRGISPLMVAVGAENLPIIETFIKHGANVNGKGIQGITPLIYAAMSCSNTDVIKTLIKNGADVNGANNAGETVLMLAVAENKTNPKGVINTLIKHGADVNAKAPMLQTTVLHAAIQKENLDAVETLLENGANVNEKTGPGGITPLMAAVASKNVPIIKMLIKYGADVNIRDSFFNKTALDFAKERGYTELYPLLK